MSAPDEGVAADPEKPGDPPGQELKGAVAGRKVERAEGDVLVGVVGAELEVGAFEELGEPAVGAAEIEDEDLGVVLLGLDQEKIEEEALPAPRGAEDEGVANVAAAAAVEVVGEGAAPRCLEERERRPTEVFGGGRSVRRSEDWSQAGGQPGAGEDLSQLPLRRLRGQAAEPGRNLAVGLPDKLGVGAAEDAAEARRRGPPSVARGRGRPG